MHWYWIDRYTKFESHKQAEAVKAISLAEDHLHQHFRFHPIMPASLIIEGLAQTAGLLACEATGYKGKVVLAKISRMTFYETEIGAGSVLTYHANLDSLRPGGVVASVTARRGDELIGEGEFVFANLDGNTDNSFEDTTLFADGDLIDMMRIFGAYDVGIASDGSKLIDPSVSK
ncbi:MAG: 3-hydroxyacyl-ACP dehydratase FabZ family protein [Thermoguttaceae bacterium]